MIECIRIVMMGCSAMWDGVEKKTMTRLKFAVDDSRKQRIDEMSRGGMRGRVIWVVVEGHHSTFLVSDVSFVVQKR